MCPGRGLLTQGTALTKPVRPRKKKNRYLGVPSSKKLGNLVRSHLCRNRAGRCRFLFLLLCFLTSTSALIGSVTGSLSPGHSGSRLICPATKRYGLALRGWLGSGGGDPGCRRRPRSTWESLGVRSGQACSGTWGGQGWLSRSSGLLGQPAGERQPAAPTS